MFVAEKLHFQPVSCGASRVILLSLACAKGTFPLNVSSLQRNFSRRFSRVRIRGEGRRLWNKFGPLPVVNRGFDLWEIASCETTTSNLQNHHQDLLSSGPSFGFPRSFARMFEVPMNRTRSRIHDNSETSCCLANGMTILPHEKSWRLAFRNCIVLSSYHCCWA